MLPAAWWGKQAQPQQQLTGSPASCSGAGSGSGSGTASNIGSGSGSRAGGSGNTRRNASLGELLAEAGAAPVLARPGSSVFRGDGWFY
jgi:hypothetical protein